MGLHSFKPRKKPVLQHYEVYRKPAIGGWYKSTVCGVPSCHWQVYSRGLCEPHWQRWRKHGDPRAHIPLKKVKIALTWRQVQCIMCNRFIGSRGLFIHEKTCLVDDRQSLAEHGFTRRIIHELGNDLTGGWRSSENSEPPMTPELFRGIEGARRRFNPVVEEDVYLVEIQRPIPRSRCTFFVQITQEQVDEYRLKRSTFETYFRKHKMQKLLIQRRAKRLFLEHLSDEQRELWEMSDLIMVKGSLGGTYMLDTTKREHNIHEIRKDQNGRIGVIREWCGRPDDLALPLLDNALGQKLWIEADENHFRSIANPTSMPVREITITTRPYVNWNVTSGTNTSNTATTTVTTTVPLTFDIMGTSVTVDGRQVYSDDDLRQPEEAAAG